MKKIAQFSLLMCLLFVIVSFQSNEISDVVINPNDDPKITKGHLDKDFVHCNGRGKITCIL